MSHDLFKTINATIRKERLYAEVDLMREDIMKRFGIGRHRLNELLTTYANGMSFPQFKRCYGITPTEYRAGLRSNVDD